jgi:ubiquinone/menaquinone biosynthesis C-methylase UbiE
MVNDDNYLLGNVFKAIREKVFGVSLNEIAAILDTSSTSYNRFEKNNFGKNFDSKKYMTLKYWAEKISEATFEESEIDNIKLYEIIKIELINMYKESEFYEEDNLYYIEKYDTSYKELLEDFLYNMFLIFSGEVNFNFTDVDSINSHIKTQDLFRFKNSPFGRIVNFKELKNCVIKIVDVLKPKSILEIGFGTGLMSSLISQLYPEIEIIAIDERKEMKAIALENAGKDTNVNFITAGYEYLDKINYLPDLTLMVYSFHHIEDPIENKIIILRKLRSKMPPKGKLCIADIFLPESCSPSTEISETRRFWDSRITETYCNTFWNSFDSIESHEIESARTIANNAMKKELLAGDAVLNRDNEYFD